MNFTYPGVDDIIHAMSRALNIYKDKAKMDELILSNMKFDFAWEKSAEKYLTLYKN
ncbi:glycogen synthase [compost metagenome]